MIDLLQHGAPTAYGIAALTLLLHLTTRQR